MLPSPLGIPVCGMVHAEVEPAKPHEGQEVANENLECCGEDVEGLLEFRARWEETEKEMRKGQCNGTQPSDHDHDLTPEPSDGHAVVERTRDGIEPIRGNEECRENGGEGDGARDGGNNGRRTGEQQVGRQSRFKENQRGAEAGD